MNLSAILGMLPGLLAMESSAQSQGVPPAQVDAYRAAYRELLRRPLDLDSLFRFAELAEQVGEPRVAARALERVLLTNPALTAVRVKLGIVYFNLGERTLARTQLLQALDDPNASAAVLSVAQQYLDALDRGQERHELVGSAELGVRYQTNANAGPSDNRVLFEGQTVEVPHASRPKDDEDLYGLLALKHSYRTSAEGNAWESTLDGFLSLRREQQQLNYLSLVGTTGLRITDTDPLTFEKTIRPHLIAIYQGLDESTYAAGGGAGIDGTWRFSPTLLGDYRLTGIYSFYNDTSHLPQNSDYEGFGIGANIGATFDLSRSTALRLGLLGGRDFARDDDQSNNELGLELGVIKAYASPWGLTSRPWSSSLSGQWVYAWYDEADDEIDPDNRRRDQRLRISAETSVPLTENTAFVVQGGFAHNGSTLRNYQWINLDLSAGVRVQF